MSHTPEHEPLAFLKMHGLGNDFVVVDARGRVAVSYTHLTLPTKA